jgi:hypothetical protein
VYENAQEFAEDLSKLGPSELVVLLGAGASVDAGVPTSRAMTQELLTAINKKPGGPFAEALQFVHDTLVAHDRSAGHDLSAGIDVERLFSAVELLGDLGGLEVTPFVQAWHPVVAEWNSFTGHRTFTVDVSEPGGDLYRKLAEHMVAALRSIVATDPCQVGYLAPLIAAADRIGGLTVATLNYDVAVEQALAIIKGSGVQDPTSIDVWGEDHRWAWTENGLRLLKLHGSIGWHWVSLPGWGHRGTYRTVWREGRRYDRLGFINHPPALVFGRRGKLRARGPFLSLLAQFEAFMATTRCLVVIGYSFNDEHVNELIKWWMEVGSSGPFGGMGSIVLVDPNFPEQRRTLWGRLHWLSDPERVHVMRIGAGDALRKLFPDRT